MDMGVVGGRRGIVAEMNVVPLIDILLVLLVIFMIIPHRQKGLDAVIPQQQTDRTVPYDPPRTIIVQIASDGSVRINRLEVRFERLGDRLQEIFARGPIESRFFKRIVLMNFKRLPRFWTSCIRRAPHPSGC